MFIISHNTISTDCMLIQALSERIPGLGKLWFIQVHLDVNYLPRDFNMCTRYFSLYYILKIYS